jgi:hypothetical protein
MVRAPFDWGVQRLNGEFSDASTCMIFIFQFGSFQKLLSRATAKCFGQQPDYDRDNTHHEDYACPDTGFENVANQLTACERK